MRRIALLSGLLLASAGVTTAANATVTKHHVHHRWYSAQARARAPEILTTVGTPDCHVQGRLLRVANHCPPEAISAAPR